MRIVFTRNIKLPPSGAKAKKKPWPLLQTMMFLKPYVTAKGNDQPSNLPPLTSAVDDSSTADNTKGERVDNVPLEEVPVEEGEETNRETDAENSCTFETRTIISHSPPSKKKTDKPVNADEFLMILLPDLEEMMHHNSINFGGRMAYISSVIIQSNLNTVMVGGVFTISIDCQSASTFSNLQCGRK
ncbi:hypothetical protein J6590_038150 [Homalodisca vitripennis]|nr:hypothetical protein J6590_038150 [Homalodisca vitripennis]